MVAANYKQTLSLKIGIKQRLPQIISIVLQALSIGFIVVGILYNFYFYIGFLLMYALGLVFYQIYFSTPREYEYALTEDRITFIKKNVRLQAKTVLAVGFSEIKSVKIFSDFVKEGEKVFTDDVSRNDAKELEYEINGVKSFLVFAPDDYMTALLDDKLSELKKQKVEITTEKQL